MDLITGEKLQNFADLVICTQPIKNFHKNIVTYSKNIITLNGNLKKINTITDSEIMEINKYRN